MIETIFYLQMGAYLLLLTYAFFSKSASMFALAGIISISTGAMLAAGEPIEFFTGGFTVEENSDANVWDSSPDLNALSISNSAPVNTWHYLLLYGGFVWIIAAFILAVKGRIGINIEEAR